jgi:hypothetical protein
MISKTFCLFKLFKNLFSAEIIIKAYQWRIQDFILGWGELKNVFSWDILQTVIDNELR